MQLLKWMKKLQSPWELILPIIKFYPLRKELFLAGFAGALFAHVMAYISPADFAYHRAIDILIFSIFGGSEVIWGAVFGATFMTILPEALRFISEYRYMIYGVILIVLMAFRPQGIIDVNLLNWFKKI